MTNATHAIKADSMIALASDQYSTERGRASWFEKSACLFIELDIDMKTT
jgi:hypothetical protein